jgi:hypothetical protein
MQKMLHPTLNVRKQHVSHYRAAAHHPDAERHQEEVHAADIELAQKDGHDHAHHANIRLRLQQQQNQAEDRDRDEQAGETWCPSPFADQPRRDDGKAWLEKFGRLYGETMERDPPPCPFDLNANRQRRSRQTQREDTPDDGQSFDVAGRQQGNANNRDASQGQKEHLLEDEQITGRSDALRDSR